MKGLDITNQRFGKLIACEQTGEKAGTSYLWKCLCDCGKEKVTTAGRLRAGQTKSCGCLRATTSRENGKKRSTPADELKALIGERFGNLVVTSTARRRTKNNKSRVYLNCKCDCGQKSSVIKGHLTSGATQSCGCQQGKQAYSKDKIPRYPRYSAYKQSAKTRKLSFDLSKHDFEKTIKTSCYYCGIQPASGIDRYDSAVGYVLDNCVPCCRKCNWAKNAFSITDFSEWVRRIHKHLTDTKWGN
jgi:hypothetical protein